MDRLLKNMSPAQADQLIGQMASRKLPQQGKNLYARVEGQGEAATVKLFTRSSRNEAWLRLWNPDKLQQQRRDAAGAITAALHKQYPTETAVKLLGVLGLDAANDKGIKLARLRQNIGGFEQIEMDHRTRSLDTTATVKNLQFTQWHLAPSPELTHFVGLSGEDLMTLMAVKQQIPPTALMAFQSFAEHSLQPAHQKSKDASISKTDVLGFLSGWCALNAMEKDALLAKLSPDGQSALKAVDVLVKKMIAAEKLPLSASDGFGVHRDLTRRKGFDAIQGAVRMHLMRSAQTNREPAPAARMSTAAQNLGQAIASEWKKQGTTVNYMAKQHELVNVLRSFADRHLSPEALGIPAEHKALAETRWRAYRESFVNEACTAALDSFYSGPVTLRDNAVFVGVKSYPLAGRKLGEGAEGVVLQLTDASGLSIAVKSIAHGAGEPEKDALLREAGMHHIAGQTRHPNLVQMLGCARDAQGNLSICMEFAPHGSIEDYGKRFDQQARSDMRLNDASKADKLRQVDNYVFKSVLQGLSALHGAGLIHRDLKPQNVFIGLGGTPKIGDFGKAAMLTESITRNKPVDTAQWLAPELAVLDTKQYVDASPASDVWASAMMMFELVTGGNFPLDFSSDRGIDRFSKLKEFAANPLMTNFDQRFTALKLDQLADQGLARQLCQMLHPVPSQRPSASQVLDWLSRQGPADDAALGKLLVDLTTAQ